VAGPVGTLNGLVEVIVIVTVSGKRPVSVTEPVATGKEIGIVGIVDVNESVTAGSEPVTEGAPEMGTENVLVGTENVLVGIKVSVGTTKVSVVVAVSVGIGSVSVGTVPVGIGRVSVIPIVSGPQAPETVMVSVFVLYLVTVLYSPLGTNRVTCVVMSSKFCGTSPAACTATTALSAMRAPNVNDTISGQGSAMHK